MVSTITSYVRDAATQKANRLRQLYYEDGFMGVARKTSDKLKWLATHRWYDIRFDRNMGIDTKGCVPLRQLSLSSPNVQFGVRYEPVDPRVFHRALQVIDRDFRDFAFVDVGSGKGRALVLASQYGFKRIMGVDFAPQLVEIARKNCRRLGVQATIDCRDATTYEFPGGNSVVHLFNPFHPPVLRVVVSNLVMRNAEGETFLVYINPVYARELDQMGTLRRVSKDRNFVVWRLGKEAI